MEMTVSQNLNDSNGTLGRASDRIEVEVRVFGIFREMCGEPLLRLEMPENAKASDVKTELANRISKLNPTQRCKIVNLLSRSAIADDDHFLDEDEVIQNGINLNVLPPVCGG